jgi:hypothetical protein
MAMRRNTLPLVALTGALVVGAVGAAQATFVGPDYYPYITGNDTGGIISYAPAPKGVFEEMAQTYCARWRRLSHITSVHRIYGDYVSFVCIDNPGMIH